MPRPIIRISSKSVLLSLIVSLEQNASAFEAKLSGFGSIVAGKILKGDPDGGTDLLKCPCYVSDWGIGAAYQGMEPSLKQESRVGAQLYLDLGADFSAYIQGVARAYDQVIKLDWAYLSYQLTPQLSLQLGRKRIPIFYYSEFQDIGYAYTWIRPPNELYGWDLTNYNGASLRYRGGIGDYSVNISFYAGNSQLDASPYWKINYEEPVGSRWRKLLGAEVEFSNDIWTSRFVHLQSENQYNFNGEGWADYNFNVGQASKQSVFGWANNFDFGRFFILSEMNATFITSQDIDLLAPSVTFGIGYRQGKWTILPNYAQYADFYKLPEDESGARYDDSSLTIRYDLTASSDLKFQYTYSEDFLPTPFLGDTQHASVSYDFIF